MPSIELRSYQTDAVERMRNGCILCGGVGSGKSITALAYYYIQNNGTLGDTNAEENRMKDPKDLYIITTARKRDSHEWDGELSYFMLSQTDNTYPNKVKVDSWNNIAKYVDVQGAFFLFDEQRVVGKGAWVKSFLKITRKNEWVLLSATPGDTWEDYIPVFIANGFYRNRTEFTREHIIYKRYTTYPQIDRYINTGRLLRLRRRILVNMDFQRETKAHHEIIYTDFDRVLYKLVVGKRWNIYKDEPCTNASEYCQVLRRIVNSDESRQEKLLELCDKHDRVIIFYNFDYELEILKNLKYKDGVKIAEWNGHKHQEIPEGTKWVYLVQYNAGSEAWNCIKTDTIIFFSQNYSYKMMHQAAGRIDRMNTPYTDLYYYHFKSRSSIDVAIGRALSEKKKFNESGFAGKYFNTKNTKVGK